MEGVKSMKAVQYKGERVRPGQIVLFVVLIVLVLLFLAPLFISFMSAFKTNGEILKNPLAFPGSLYTGGFEYLFAKTDFPRAFSTASF